MISSKLLLLLQGLLALSYVACLPSRRRYSGTCPADANEPWSYRGLNGPPYWGESYRTCYGNKQSPIELTSRRTTPDRSLGTLKLNNYDKPLGKARIENNGHTVQVTPEDGVQRSIIVNGDTYKLQQLHFHWGDRYDKGAEHILEGTQYAMELHLVHQNSRRQTAVVGVFFQETTRKNNALQAIVKDLSRVPYKDDITRLSSKLDLRGLLPNNLSSYYRYTGSLTTPPCTEGVTWTVMKEIMQVGKTQMSPFRKLYSAERNEAEPGCKLVNNFRPVQPLNGRQVYTS